ncbi:MAG: response regulator [Lachnospiraceae bacterium]|nr:response regulator [Lachnospiraceae bacterium]
MISDSINFQGMKALSLNDNGHDNYLMGELLRELQIVCDEVSDSEEAVQKLQCNKYDIIFIDFMLAKEDGVTALGRIHNTHLCDDTPVIILTEGNGGVARHNYLNAGFSGCLELPLTGAKLKNAISHCLKPNPAPEAEKAALNHILVIDDDDMNLFVAKKILSQKFQVTGKNSGRAAFEYLEAESVDLILLDIRMPEMDGFTFLELIREKPQLKDIPIICLTADNEHTTEIKCFQLGAVDFITKPFVAEIMLQRINRTLELSRLQKELQTEVEKKTITLNKRSRQLNRLTIQVMETLAGTIDAKDKYTNGHSVRVAEYSRMIAERSDLTPNEQEDIYYIGLLHDIGKIGIPDEIINKPTALTDAEYAVIKKHPEIGAEILEKMSEVPGITYGARWHHERYDGTGYPDGLAGNQIPRVARIIGVADAYDTMSSKRSYRDVLPQAHIREEIERGRGTQFDPEYAEIMLQIIDEDKEYQLREW